MNHWKNQYVAPTINSTTIEMESGIAAGSASLKPGSPNAPFVPEVEDWSTSGNQSQDFGML